MGLFNSIATGVVIAMVLGYSTATAGKLNYGNAGRGGSIQHLPPMEYANQWWVHPSGCEYSRAGRPGEVVWYIIINSIGRKTCPRLIVQQAMGSPYKDMLPTN